VVLTFKINLTVNFFYQERVATDVCSMVNEAACCLDEKVIETLSDVDLGMIMGTGFVLFRGGLLHYADSVGLAKIISRLEELKGIRGFVGLHVGISKQNRILVF